MKKFPSASIKINIDSNTIFRIILILIGIWFLYYIRDVLVIIFIAFVLVSAITPLVDFLERFRLPRSLVTLAIYLALGAGFFYLISLLIPAVAEQIRLLANNLPTYGKELGAIQDRFQHLVESQGLFQQEKTEFLINLSNRLGEGWLNIFSQAGSFIRGIINFVAIISLSFYLSVQKKNVSVFLRSFIPKEHQNYVIVLMDRIQAKMGYWLLGQLTLNVIIGVLVYIGLRLLGVPYALLLALLAGMFEVIPYLGPILSSLAGILVALSISPLAGLLVLIMYIIIQQLENHLIVPLVMKQAVGLNPVAVIIAILVGIKLAGALGLLLAIPLTAVISVFIADFISSDVPTELKSQRKS